jgi:16S rRNA (cytosine967-C5)-methyltransferase
MKVQPAGYSPVGLRILPLDDGRAVSVQFEPGFQKGFFEIQDEGSQLAAILAAPDPGMQIIDLCAGGGGKTLALAALMDNRGQIFATDSDKRRLAPIFDRMTRAGVRNVQVRSPKGKEDEPLEGLEGHIDLVVVDAPCTGTGTWRRNPDAKWRVRPNALEDRIKEQADVLDRAAHYVKLGGRIAYITCSLLPRENDGAVGEFLARNDAFEALDPVDVANHAGLDGLASFVSAGGLGLQLTPKRTGTDGFYISVLKKVA